MPPVRWKQLLLVASLIILQHLMKIADAQHTHDAVSMTEDGWRPIIGTRRLPPAFESNVRINQYHHPSHDSDVEIVKSESTLQISSTVSPFQFKPKTREPVKEANNLINGGTTIYHFNQANKKSPENKLTPPPGYHTIPTGTYRPQISHSAVTVGRPSQFGIKKPLMKGTSPPRHNQNTKRKPVKAPLGAHSTRQEVYIPATSSDGFALRKPGQSNLKTRETQGLGLFGTNQYTLNQPNNQFEFANRFAVPANGGHVFEQFKSNPVTYIFSKGPPFKTQNDEYTRNLVPPQPQDKEREHPKNKPSSMFKDNAVVPSIQEPVSFGIKQIAQFGLRPPQLHENLVSQLHFEPNFGFQKQIKAKEPAVDVQVTKEKLKVFHNNFSPNLSQKPGGYINYDFHGFNNNNQPGLPKLQTYEVTEGKWLDNPNPFTYSFLPSLGPTPQSSNSILSTARPQLISEPIVELNLPPFLPTPVRPEGTIASPSQAEVSTVFAQVSSKMNKYKSEQLNKNPLFFDVKEVSTHYPVLGRPEFIQETQSTDTPLPMSENGDISNDISTTPKPKTRRRRPQPRRPTSTTTTTEEPVTENLSYELQKMQDYESEMTMETEAPQRRLKQRPNRHRINTNSDNYRITTPSDSYEMSGEKRLRGRHRYRQRGNDIRYQPQRKRMRPSNTEAPLNHKMTETDPPFSHETTDNTDEIQGIFETKSVKSTRSEEDASNTSSDRMEYQAAPKRKYVKSQEESLPQYETTTVNDELPGLKLSIEEVTLPAVTTTTQETTVVSLNSPENEVDYTTPELIEQNTKVEQVQTTLATTIPTTSTSEVQTTKPTRTRGRPSKYNTGNRPRFSVKDYRQRLNQYTSTTPSTTTDFIRTSEGPRIRFPNRLRTRPTGSVTTTTTQQYQIEEEDTTEVTNRRRFRPKEPRYPITESTNIINDPKVKSVNTRLRPFGRYKSSTESTIPAVKVSIKPNLFDVAKRRPPLSMRNKLYKDKAVEETTLPNEIETTEAEITVVEAPEGEEATIESATHLYSDRGSELSTETSVTSTVNISDDDYSQRVSELTSSLKNEYETPGLFKTFSPNTRRIPNYFTISTEDPILPIEAFFPNLKEKEKEQ